MGQSMGLKNHSAQAKWKHINFSSDTLILDRTNGVVYEVELFFNLEISKFNYHYFQTIPKEEHEKFEKFKKENLKWNKKQFRRKNGN